MLFLTKEILESKDLFNKIEDEKTIINLIIKSQNIKKEIIIDNLKKFSEQTQSIEIENKTDKVMLVLEKFKICLILYKSNIYLLESLLNILDNLKKIENLDEFNKKYSNINRTILNNEIQIEKILNDILENAFNLPDKVEKKEYKSNHPENTLIISEREGKVVLPFSIEKVLEECQDDNIEEVIDKKYTVSLNLYKNSAVSRFKEAFKLMREKEKESLKKSLELGIELFFNYNLHPAIISACKNLDELDIYLDCLEENEIDKFDCFKIIFDISPVLSKKK